MRQAVHDRAVRLRQPLLRGAAGARPRAGEAVTVAAAVSAGVAAAIHAAAIGPHLGESRLFAGAFAAMAVAQGGWMVLVLVGPSRRRYLAGAGLNGAIALIWLLSRTVGLPMGPHSWVAEPVGAMDAIATLGEVVAVLGSLVLVARMKPGGAQLPTPASVICLCHGSQFDVATGAVLNPPATEPVKTYPVRVESDDLQVGT